MQHQAVKMFLCSFDHFKRDMILEISQQCACVYLCSVEQFKPMLFKLDDQKNKSSQQCQSVEEVVRQVVIVSRSATLRSVSFILSAARLFLKWVSRC